MEVTLVCIHMSLFSRTELFPFAVTLFVTPVGFSSCVETKQTPYSEILYNVTRTGQSQYSTIILQQLK